MTKQMYCVACPLGCFITVEYDDTGILNVTGNTCKRGIDYARTEMTNPTRSLTSTIRVIGGKRAVIPCKSHEPLPKNMMFDCMKEINKARVKAPAKIGDVLIPDILGTGIDIVATDNCD
ncbi:MAG TPA: DUF1667 domain-containing protein [Clostridiales bacterium]|nr:DUF1667 domain-containing protein [Clostridiales bacterium]